MSKTPTSITFLLLAFLATTCYATFSYTCYANETIVAANPDPAIYTNAFANDSDAVCTVNIGGDDLATITGCNMDDDILLEFTNRTTTGDLILGGKANTVFLIRCNDIDEDGVTRTVIVGFTPSIDPAVQANVTPSFDVHSAIRISFSFPSSSPVLTAVIGTALYWTIDIPVQYYGRPKNCYAVSGTDAFDSSAISVSLIVDGCSQDVDLVHDFKDSVTSSHKYRMYTDFFVFKFYDSHYITIHCSVRICLTSEACAVDCSSHGRSKREAVPEAAALAGEIGASSTIRVVDKLSVSGGRHTGPEMVLMVVGFIVAMVTRPVDRCHF